MPRILYGTAWKKADTARLVHAALRAGFRGLDTACQPRHYDEPGVGAGIAAAREAGLLAREQLWVQSKFTPLSGQDPARIPYDAAAPLETQMQQSFAASLRNLRTGYLDCLILHSPLATARETLEVWRAMERVAAAGGARRLGLSNCYSLAQLESLYRSARVKPTVLQNRFYAATNHDREIRAFCRANDITYQSFWTLTANPQLLGHRTVAGLAARYGRTPVQVFFRALTQVGIVPLTATRDEAHMRADLAIFEFELPAEEIEAVSRLLGNSA